MTRSNFRDGKVVLVTRLCPGQRATVLQLPAAGEMVHAEPARTPASEAQEAHSVDAV